jgi:hypothetical protein
VRGNRPTDFIEPTSHRHADAFTTVDLQCGENGHAGQSAEFAPTFGYDLVAPDGDHGDGIEIARVRALKR